jgi:hypothetical protein
MEFNARGGIGHLPILQYPQCFCRRNAYLEIDRARTHSDLVDVGSAHVRY